MADDGKGWQVKGKACVTGGSDPSYKAALSTKKASSSTVKGGKIPPPLPKPVRPAKPAKPDPKHTMQRHNTRSMTHNERHSSSIHP